MAETLEGTSRPPQGLGKPRDGGGSHRRKRREVPGARDAEPSTALLQRRHISNIPADAVHRE